MNKRSRAGAEMLVSRFAPNSPVIEAYRILQANLQFLSIDRLLQSLVLTGVGPQAGKTLTAANLGVVMAQAGKQVILVDSDLRRPTLHTVFNCPNEKGLSNILIGEAAASTVLRATEIANLRLLTSGALPPNPVELLSSQRMRGTVDVLTRMGDCVLIDTPPVLAMADAAIIAALAEGTLLVLAAGATPPAQAVQAKSILTAAKAKLIGVVLNNVRSGSDLAYSYY